MAILGDLRKNLNMLNYRSDSKKTPDVLSAIHSTKKAIARVRTVITQRTWNELREKHKGDKYVPLQLRTKKTRALRRKLTKHQENKKTLRAIKRNRAFPQRVYAVLPSQ